MKGLLHKDKKAVSEMIGYVLLITIAVGLSILVYAYLKVYIPKEKATCTDDTFLVIQDYTCTSGNPGALTLNLTNKGLFNVDAVFVRFGPSSKRILTQINDPSKTGVEGFNFFNGLKPGENYYHSYNTGNTPDGDYKVEIEAAVRNDKGEFALCDKSTATQIITCQPPQTP